jgi:hypothetical protein
VCVYICVCAFKACIRVNEICACMCICVCARICVYVCMFWMYVDVRVCMRTRLRACTSLNEYVSIYQCTVC